VAADRVERAKGPRPAKSDAELLLLVVAASVRIRVAGDDATAHAKGHAASPRVGV
jgi:hypothetical protein